MRHLRIARGDQHDPSSPPGGRRFVEPTSDAFVDVLIAERVPDDQQRIRITKRSRPGEQELDIGSLGPQLPGLAEDHSWVWVPVGLRESKRGQWKLARLSPTTVE